MNPIVYLLLSFLFLQFATRLLLHKVPHKIWMISLEGEGKAGKQKYYRILAKDYGRDSEPLFPSKER
jgi:hypothetical protein